MPSRLTLYEIAGNDDILIQAAGPDENGLFSGWNTRGPEKYCRELIVSNFIFRSAGEAKQAMQLIVDWAKVWTEEDIKKPDNPLHILACQSPEEFQAIKAIVGASQKTPPA